MATYYFKIDGQTISTASDPAWFAGLQQQYPNGVVDSEPTDASQYLTIGVADQPQPVATGVQEL